MLFEILFPHRLLSIENLAVLYREIASRKHIENILPVIDEALRQANVKLEEIDAVAVT